MIQDASYRVKSLSMHRRNLTSQNTNLQNVSLANTHFELLVVPKVTSKQAALFSSRDQGTGKVRHSLVASPMAATSVFNTAR